MNYTTTVITPTAIRCFTPTEEDVATWSTYKTTNTKSLQGFEWIETNLTDAAFADWLKLWDCFPPPSQASGTAKLMEFTACLQIMSLQCSHGQRRAVFTLSLNASLFLNTDLIIGFMGIGYGILCPTFCLHV